MTVTTTASQDRLLERYAELVEASPHNLMSRRALAELRSRHIPECVAFSAELPRRVGPVLDVGSGGGLPGIVMAIVRPDLTVDLLEATGKKVEFLRSVAAALNLDVTIHHGRAEALGAGELAGSFEVCTARAVAPLPRLLGWTLPFLRPGGLLYAIKGRQWRDEVAEASGQLRTWGGEIVATPDELGTTGDGPRPRIVIIRRGVPG